MKTVGTRIRRAESHRRWRILAASGAAVSIVLTACGARDSGGEEAGDGPYQVGFLAALSGPLAPVGSSVLDGMNLVIDAANEDGGIEGRQIEVVTADTEGDSATGITAARSLAGRGDVVLVTGGVLSQVVEAVLPTFEREGISFIAQGAPPSVLDPVRETVFMIEQTSSSNAQPMVEFTEQLLGTSDFTAAIGPVDTPSGVAWGDNVETLAEMKGFTISSRTPVPVTAGDMTAQAQNLLAGSPDVLLIEAPDAPLVPLVQKVRELGYEGPIVNFSFGSATATLERLADDQLYVMRTSDQYDTRSEDEGTQRFVELVDAADKVETARSATQFSQGYEIGLMVVAALETCGASCDAAAVTEALNDISVDTGGFTPRPLEFTPEDHQASNAGAFYVWDGSAPVPALDGEAFPGSVYTLEAE